MHLLKYKRPLRARVSPEEYQLLLRLREQKPSQHPPSQKPSVGERLADSVATTMGSWRFIVIQSALLFIWVCLNVTAFIQHWDPYPFILLNLMLSFQAAYAAPIIMMSQNRQADIDRKEARHDYEVNLKAELEIELLHDKMNSLREQEIVEIKSLLIEYQQQFNELKTSLTNLLGKGSNTLPLADERDFLDRVDNIKDS